MTFAKLPYAPGCSRHHEEVKIRPSAHDGTKAAACLVTLSALLFASGCGTTATQADAGPLAKPSATRTAAARGPEQVQTPKVKIPRPADPLASTASLRVIRSGQRAKPSVSASPKPFSKKVTYTDGLGLKITDIKQGAVTGQGPGFLTGQPTTAFSVVLTNGTMKPIALNNVVVTTTYGTPRRVASPIYDVGSQDFHGTAKPGATAKALYVFSVPKADLGDVTMMVNFDGLHASATFKGSAR